MVNQLELEGLWEKRKRGKLRSNEISQKKMKRDIIMTALGALPFVDVVEEDGDRALKANGEKAFFSKLWIRAQKDIREKISALVDKGLFPIKCEAGCDNNYNKLRIVNYRSGYVICSVCGAEKLVDFDELLDSV